MEGAEENLQFKKGGREENMQYDKKNRQVLQYTALNGNING